MNTDRRGTLRIAITADPELPVPPSHYGGIERVVAFLVDGLIARGHEVTLFAHQASRMACEVVPYPASSSRDAIGTLRNAACVTRRVLMRRYDVIHSFGRLAYLGPLTFSAVPKLMTYQRAITRRSVAAATRLFGRSIEFTACGRHMIADLESDGRWHIVPNGVPIDRYRFEARVEADAPLVFLGRIEHIKGAHIAVAAARQAKRRLILAGIVERAHEAYFRDQIAPYVDGTRVEYVGPVDDAAKNELLGRAAALLMPVLWDEPFGIVMAEALACGTPVIGLRRGSVPEVVADGVTGFVVDDERGVVDAISRLNGIDRTACRREAERRFADHVIVDAYESIYVTICSRVGSAIARGTVLNPAAHRDRVS